MAKHHTITTKAALIVGGMLALTLSISPTYAQSIPGYGQDLAGYYNDVNRRAAEREQVENQLEMVRREQRRLQDEIDLRDTLSRSQNPWGPR